MKDNQTNKMLLKILDIILGSERSDKCFNFTIIYVFLFVCISS